MGIFDEFVDGINNTLKLVDNIKSLSEKNINENFKKIYITWRQYFVLYKKCYNIFCRESTEYIYALNSLSKKFSSISQANDNLGIYSERLRASLDETSDLIKFSKTYNDIIHFKLSQIVKKIEKFIKQNSDNEMLIKSYEKIYNTDFKGEKIVVDEIIGNFERSILGSITGSNKGKSIFLGKLNEMRRDFAEAVKDLSEEFSKVKKEAMKLVGISSKGFIERNILQKTESAPIRILSDFYHALKDNSCIPDYNLKDLLKISKGLDFKIKNSMKKVIDYNWELDHKMYNGLDAKNLAKNTKELIDTANRCAKTINFSIEKLETIGSLQSKQILEELKRVRFALESAPSVLGTSSEKELISLLSRSLSCELACNVIFNCLDSLDKPVSNTLNTEFGDEEIRKLLFDQNPSKLKNIIMSSISILGFIMGLTPLVSQFIGMFSEKIGQTVDLIAQQRFTVRDMLNRARDACSYIR